MVRSTAVAVLAALLLMPSVALAQSTPFAPLPAAPQEQTDPTVTTAPAADDDGISSLQQTLLIGAGILFVLGIGVAIAYDARRNAPGEDRPGARPLPKDENEIGERKPRDPRTQAKQKAAAKRARQARKKNRPVRK